MMNIMNPPADWSTLKKLIWLRGTPTTGGEELTVSGTPPLSLPNSLGKPLKAWSVELSPYQDLHGYDNPWPAGGGKNKLDSQVEAIGYIRGSDGAFVSGAQAWKCSTVFSPILPNTDYVLHKYATSSSSVAGYAIYDENENYIDGDSYGSVATVNITTPQNARYIRASWGANAATPVALMLATESDTSYAPYSNICPILGTDKVTVWTSGKNLCPVNEYSGNPRYFWGTNYSTLVQWLNTLDIGTYTITNKFSIVTVPSSGTVTHGNIWIRATVNGAVINVNTDSTTTDDTPYVGKVYSESSTFTITDEIKGNISYAYIYCDSSTTHSGSDTSVRGAYNTYDTMVELGSTASDFVPYVAPSSTVITLPNTLYTGTIGSDGGESRWGEVDLGDLAWEYICVSNKYFQTNSIKNIVKPPVTGSTVVDAMCEAYKMVSWNATTYATGLMAIAGANNPDPGRLSCINTNYTDVASFAAAMRGIKLVFELKTPTTFAVPSPTIPTPTGTATTWATAEDGTVDSMEVTYVGKA